MTIKQTFKSVHDTGKVPEGWQKIYAIGTGGVEIHYFQHVSGEVFNVKIKRIIS